MCLVPNGYIVTLDQTNTLVRLLNMQLDELDQCNVYGSNFDKWSIHCVSERQVVLSTRNETRYDQYELIFQFLYVSQNHITLTRRVQLDDALNVYDWVKYMTVFCDKLYIGSSTGIHIFSLDLDLVRSMFKGGNVAHGAINWDRMYVAGTYANSLITLDSDGHIVNTLKEPGLGIIHDIVVADNETVFVCGSNSIIQVDRDGGRTISTIATEAGGIKGALQMSYNRATSELIVLLSDKQLMSVKVKN